MRYQHPKSVMRQRPRILLVLILSVSSVHVSAESVDVRDYGAKGDDKSDDTSAFVAALRAGRNVYVPKGVYRIGTVTLPDETWLHGDGPHKIMESNDQWQFNTAVSQSNK